jgi:ATP-dependent protease HslVU (ClpYQ) peptidase subunit
MTCILGLVHNNQVWIGGDSAGVGGLSLSVRADQKVFRNGEFLFGFTSSFRMGQILRYRFDPKPIPDWDLEKYMCTTFVDEIRACFKQYGFAESRAGSDVGGTFLVGVRGRLFCVMGDYQVGWNHKPYDAVGCGDDLAKGALDALHMLPQKPEPRFIVETALTSAANWSAGVCAPWTIDYIEHNV